MKHRIIVMTRLAEFYVIRVGINGETSLVAKERKAIKKDGSTYGVNSSVKNLGV